MKSCLDIDALMAVGAALNWRSDDGLRHLAECESCRAQLAELAVVRQSLTEVAEPADGFVDLVMATLPDAGSEVVEGSEPWTALDLVNPVLAGLTALVAVLLVGKPIVAPGAAAIGAAIAAGATLWWNRTVAQ